jgi:PadR family transcriptional regulator PadR
MPSTLDIEQWSTQLRKGLAELCVLAAVHRLGEAYGYQLVQFLTNHDGLELTESTVYPLLARLAREGHLSITTTPSPNGPPRRYYRITAHGKRSLEAMLEQWAAVGLSVQRITQSNHSPEK